MPEKQPELKAEANARKHWSEELKAKGFRQPEDLKAFPPSLRMAIEQRVRADLKEKFAEEELDTLRFKWQDTTQEGVHISLSGGPEVVRAFNQYINDTLIPLSGMSGTFDAKREVAPLKPHAKAAVTLTAHTNEDMARALGIDFHLSPTKGH